MSTALESPTLSATPEHGKAGFRQLVVSEWTKVRSVRSTWISLAIVVLAGIGISTLVSSLEAGRWTQLSITERINYDPVRFSQGGIFISQFVVGVLGALVITSEYSTGLIRTTLAAVPRRAPLALAKALVLAVIVFVVGELTAFGSFFVSRSILLAHGGQVLPANATLSDKLRATAAPVVALGSPGVAPAVFRTGLYLVLIALVALGIGLILRHTTGAISLFVGVLLIIPLLIQLLPASITRSIQPRLPSNLGLAMTETAVRKTDFSGVLLAPWSATLLLAIYAVVIVGIGVWMLIRRDA
jgi:hypothetical protein